MTEEEKKAIEDLKVKIEFMGDNYYKIMSSQAFNDLRKETKVAFNLIEKLQKERDIYYYELKTLEADLINKNLIPKGKIREKIEELENEREQLRIDKGVTYDSGIYKISLIIETYKELLEEE